MNSRRKLLIALSAGTLLPHWAAAQPAGVLRIGWLSPDKSAESPFFDAFRGGMRDLGYVEGRNLVIEARYGEGSTAPLDKLAVELIGLKPQIIVAGGGPGVHALMRAGATMPVVFGYSGDPVEGKVVDSLARPGRNFTGMSMLSLDLVGKRLELLKEVMPGLKRIATLANPRHVGEQSELRASQAAAKSLGLTLQYFPVQSLAQIEEAFGPILKSGSEALDAFPEGLTMRNRERIAAFATKNRIPAISGWAEFADGGNLMSYGPNLRDVYRRLAAYVDRIAKGAKPADLPVELPTTVEFVVNLKAAKALGIKIPQSVLLRADRVIE